MTTTTLSSGTGVVVNGYTYDIYGKKTSSTGSQPNEFDFAGQQTDPTGLQYLRARYYDPETGTFLSRDLLEEAGGTGVSPYAYAAGRPTSLTDRTGLAPWDDAEARWCAQRPWWWARCAAAAVITRVAIGITTAVFGNESSEADAFRHCLWSACLTFNMGSKSAKTITDVHERVDSSGDRQEQRKDLWNNKTGRDIGKKIILGGFIGEYAVAQAIAACLDALAKGGLIVDSSTAPYYPGEEAILPFPPGGGGSW